MRSLALTVASSSRVVEADDVLERLPAKLVRTARRPGPEARNVLVQEADRVPPHLLALPRRVVRGGDAVGVLQDVAEVGERARRAGPALARDQVAHVRPGVERLDEAGDADRRPRPAELRHVRLHPYLEGLGRDRLHALDHRPPAGVA